MPYNAGTYTPGDAWTSTDFYSSALVPPRISMVFDANTDETTASYFEYRTSNSRMSQYIDIFIGYATGSGAFSVVLQVSDNGGSTWATVKTYTAPTADQITPAGPSMFKLKCNSIAGGTTLNVSLKQYP